MGIEIALGVAALAGGAIWGASEISKSQERKAAKSAPQAGPQDIGNLTKEEATTSASKKMFREGLFFTSPTGVQGGGTRGRSRLFGA